MTVRQLIKKLSEVPESAQDFPVIFTGRDDDFADVCGVSIDYEHPSVELDGDYTRCCQSMREYLTARAEDRAAAKIAQESSPKHHIRPVEV